MSLPKYCKPVSILKPSSVINYVDGSMFPVYFARKLLAGSGWCPLVDSIRFISENQALIIVKLGTRYNSLSYHTWMLFGLL